MIAGEPEGGLWSSFVPKSMLLSRRRRLDNAGALDCSLERLLFLFRRRRRRLRLDGTSQRAPDGVAVRRVVLRVQ